MILQDAAQRKVNPDNIAPASRDHLIPFLERVGTHNTAVSNPLCSWMTPRGQETCETIPKCFCQRGEVIWIVGLSLEGTIVSIDSKPE